ncbi:hypothetical protein ACET3X_006298 [Alternaria dauci]|uniref:Uncharacterized protein n=1 Tax=Alternaria dauci TaxID=48095 RepID=A0ABR3UI92_9PLEO
MPPTMRVPTVEFRSLLLPPVRIPIRALQTVYRPQYVSHIARPACPAPRLEQRRALNLYKTAKARTVLGQHKVLTFSPYTYPALKTLKHEVKLWETSKHGSKRGVIAEKISLQELYDSHVKEGQFIWCMDALDKGMAQEFLVEEGEGESKSEGKANKSLPERLTAFSTAKAHTFSMPTPKKGRPLAGLKNIVFTDTSPVSYFRLSIDRAFQFLEAGCAVEFRLRLQGKMLRKEERIKAADHRRWQWMHSYFPHLRPDFIMKAMPADTIYLIDPVSDGRVVQWVASRPDKLGNEASLNQRLFNVRSSVVRSIKEGTQSMLPKIMREQLKESGVDLYSTNTGLPKEQAREKYGRGGSATYGAEEKKWLRKFKREDAETDAFMLPDPELQEQGPVIKMGDDTPDPRTRLSKSGWVTRGRIGGALNAQKKEAKALKKAKYNKKSGSAGDGDDSKSLGDGDDSKKES